MAKRSRSEQLDQAVQAILARPDAPPPRADSKLIPLLRIARDLRDLPREDFKARLKADLERRASMANMQEQGATAARRDEAGRAVKPIREGFHTITPYLVAREAVELISFVKRAFGADELMRGTGSAGGIHAEVRIGDSIVMIGGGGAWHGTPMPTALHLYVTDADAVYKRALEAGATSTEEPTDQPYGDREAGVKDLAGNYWYIATHKGATHVREGLRTVTPYLHPRGAVQLIEFLKRAFGAGEAFREQSPEGIIHHAQVRIGDSIVEMGEAHGEYQPMPTMFYLYVSDVDALYQRALQGGATLINEPADMPYGDRVAAVADPFGNQWYIATHIKDVPM